MRSSVISQYDFLRAFPQSPSGHRQRPFLFALQIEPAQMIFQTRYKRRANLRWPAMEFPQTHG
jgi:hypothetical protein